MSLLELDGVSVAYASGARALRGLSLVVPEAGRIAVIGPNGAGKTTMTRLVTGSLRAHRGRLLAGRVLLDDKDIARVSPQRLMRAGVSQVPEGRGIFPSLSVDDNLRMVLATIRRRRRPRLDDVLGVYPVLIERRRTLAGLLSGGQQQMLAIARALATKPRLLIADELSLGLAPIITKELVNGLYQRSVDEGLAVLMVEQSAALALNFSDHTYLLDGGRVVHDDDSAALLASGTAHQIFLGGGRAEATEASDG